MVSPDVLLREREREREREAVVLFLILGRWCDTHQTSDAFKLITPQIF